MKGNPTGNEELKSGESCYNNRAAAANHNRLLLPSLPNRKNARCLNLVVAGDKGQPKIMRCRGYDSIWHIRHNGAGNLFQVIGGFGIERKDSWRSRGVA
jgi:hypothetical protein